MALRKYKPITAGTRWRIGNAYAEVTTNVPEKSLVEPKQELVDVIHQVTCQCATGVVVIRRNTVSSISKEIRKDIAATVETIEYDPNRTAFIALLNYADGEKRYIIAPQGLQVGATVISGDDVAPEIGNALQMKNMPLGTNVHNIEMQPGQGGKLARSAGSSAQLDQQRRKICGIENAMW